MDLSRIGFRLIVVREVKSQCVLNQVFILFFGSFCLTSFVVFNE
jgi:hypothetical protein